jgi:hypothetical protein
LPKPKPPGRDIHHMTVDEIWEIKDRETRRVRI